MSNQIQKAKNQRGAVLLSVMVITVVLMLLASTLINYFLTSEAAEIENSLIDVRTYWAMMGQTTYMMSRAGGQGLCGPGNPLATNATAYCTAGDDFDPSLVPPFTTRVDATPTSPAESLQKYLDSEIQTRDYAGTLTAHTIVNPGSRRWVYPQEIDHTASASSTVGTDATNPYFITVAGVVSDHLATGDGNLRIDLSVVDTGTVPALYGLKDRVDRLTVGFCVVDSQQNTDGVRFDNKGCGVATPSATHKEGMTNIQFLLRNAPIPLQ